MAITGNPIVAPVAVDSSLSDTSTRPVQNKVVKAALDNKVDKVNGKGLSTEDYTSEEKTKLSGIATGAEVNVQSDWNQTTTDADDYIKNKPTLGTAAAKNVPSTGDAANGEVVLGNDSRLTDARNAADVSSWAKASTKPTYTANEVGAIPSTDKGSANGVAELDENGHVPSSQLPSYVDDVIEGYYYEGSFYQNQEHTTGYIPENGKIYVDLSSNKTYRWGGSAYVTIASDLALGETSATAYRGDRGKTAYDDSQTNKTNIGTMSSLTTTEKGSLVGAINELDAGKVDAVSGKGLSTEDYTTAEKTKLSGIEAEANKTLIDDTLTETGQAADAKATGDAILDLSLITTEERTATGSIVTLENCPDKIPLKSCVVNIEPVQDLHGYDYPWPAGGGKNLLPTTVAIMKNRNTTGTWTGNSYLAHGVTFSINTDSDGNVISIGISGTASTEVDFQIVTASDGYTLPTGNYILTSGRSISTRYVDICNKQVYGDPVSLSVSESLNISAQIYLPQGANLTMTFSPMIRLSTVSDATFAPYSNICPISGWTGANVYGAGKNLICNNLNYLKTINTSGTWSENTYTFRDVSFTYNNDGSVYVAGTNTSSSSAASIYLVSNMLIKPGTYCFKGLPENYDTSSNQNEYMGIQINGTSSYIRWNLNADGYVFTITEDAVIDGIWIAVGKTATAHNYTYYPMLTLGSDKTIPYESPKRPAIPISWQSSAETVYGGTLDVTSGVLMDKYDWIIAQSDGSFKNANGDTISARGNNPSKYVFLDLSDQEGEIIPDSQLCNMYKIGATSTDVACCLYWSGANNQYRLTFKDSNIPGWQTATGHAGLAAAFADYVASQYSLGNILFVVWKKTTGTEYDLDPVTVTTLLGQNNIWADTGDISVTDGGYLTRVIEHADRTEDSMGFYYVEDV